MKGSEFLNPLYDQLTAKNTKKERKLFSLIDSGKRGKRPNFLHEGLKISDSSYKIMSKYTVVTTREPTL